MFLGAITHDRLPQFAQMPSRRPPPRYASFALLGVNNRVKRAAGRAANIAVWHETASLGSNRDDCPAPVD